MPSCRALRVAAKPHMLLVRALAGCCVLGWACWCLSWSGTDIHVMRMACIS